MEKELKIVVIGDSWVNPIRLKSIVKADKINITPHTTINDSRNLQVINLSEGSLSMTKVVKNVTLLNKWVETKPTITVLHAYACDIINKRCTLTPPKGTSIATFYKNWMLESLQLMKDYAKDNMDKDEYSQWISEHKFLLFNLPDWRDFKQTRSNSLNHIQYKSLRNKITRVLKKKSYAFWMTHRALIIYPAMPEAKLVGVHLNEASQVKYNAYLVKGVSRLVCARCGLQKDSPENCLNALKSTECDTR